MTRNDYSPSYNWSGKTWIPSYSAAIYRINFPVKHFARIVEDFPPPPPPPPPPPQRINDLCRMEDNRRVIIFRLRENLRFASRVSNQMALHARRWDIDRSRDHIITIYPQFIRKFIPQFCDLFRLRITSTRDRTKRLPASGRSTRSGEFPSAPRGGMTGRRVLSWTSSAIKFQTRASSRAAASRSPRWITWKFARGSARSTFPEEAGEMRHRQDGFLRSRGMRTAQAEPRGYG